MGQNDYLDAIAGATCTAVRGHVDDDIYTPDLVARLVYQAADSQPGADWSEAAAIKRFTRMIKKADKAGEVSAGRILMFCA